MVRANDKAMNREATWKRIGLVFCLATVCASSAVAEDGDLLRRRSRRLQPPSGPQQAVVKERPNPGGEVIIIPDPRPKNRPGRGGPRQEMPAAVESSPRQGWSGWIVWFVLRANS